MSGVLAVVALCWGCGNSDDRSCSVDADCFRGEMCSNDDLCVADPDAPSNNGSSSNGTGNGSTNGSAANAANGGTNGSSDVEGACVVDPFSATCDRPDDNDSFGDYIEFEDGALGCQGSGDEFTGGEKTVENYQVCPNETRDRYSVNLVPCDNKTFIVEVTMIPKQDCNPDYYEFDVNVQGNDCEEPNERVRCELLDDGRKRVTAMVEPSISIASAAITVQKNVQDLKFDYDLKVVVRE